MDVKAYLKQPQVLETRIRNRLIEREQLRALAMKITASMDAVRVRSSGGGSRMTDAVEKLVTLEAEIDELVQQLVEARRQVVDSLEALDNPTEYDVLHMRYVQGKSLQEIADHYRREYNWASTTHFRAVQHLQKRLEKSLLLEEKVARR